jgi:hypothetical protein
MATETSRSTVKRRGPDPTGRLDVCAIRLLEHAVGAYGDIPMRGIYGTYKSEIDRAIKRHLGRVRIYVPEPVQQLLQAAAPRTAPPPIVTQTQQKPRRGDVDTITMARGRDGVYEVSNGR